MSDILFDSASNFKNLLNIQYLLTFGRKNKISNLTITFNESNFCHLAGLHKLRDMPDLKRKSSINYNLILEKRLTYNDLCISPFFCEIEDRLRILLKIETILDQENSNWKYCQEKNPFHSKIKADYLIEHQNDESTSYIFITKNNSNPHHSCNSCFEFKSKDYTKNQTRLTLLEKKKLNLIDSSCEILYQREGYTPTN